MSNSSNQANIIESATVNFVIDPAEVRASVDRAVELKRVIEESTLRLEQLKATIRQAAIAKLFPANEKGTVEIRSDTGNCATVSFPRDTVRLVDGADVGKLKTELTKGEFNLMFQSKFSVLTQTFSPAFKQLVKPKQRLVSKCVVWVENTPQVQLSK